MPRLMDYHTPYGNIRPVISDSTHTIYIVFICNLHFLNYVIYLNLDESSADMGNLTLFWFSCLGPLVCFFPKILTYLAFKFPDFEQDRKNEKDSHFRKMPNILRFKHTMTGTRKEMDPLKLM
jgi:hypothetical protein